eukprot:4391535-Pleurochrysis_carterae.AAC.1
MLASRSKRLPRRILAASASGERRVEQATGSQGAKRGAERSTARGPDGATHATANANGKGGWGQKVCGSGVRERERVSCVTSGKAG